MILTLLSLSLQVHYAQLGDCQPQQLLTLGPGSTGTQSPAAVDVGCQDPAGYWQPGRTAAPEVCETPRPGGNHSCCDLPGSGMHENPRLRESRLL